MIRNRIKLVTGACAIVLMTGACSSTKQIVQKNEPTVTQTSVVELSEEKKLEFEYLFIEGLKQKMIGNPNNAVPLFSKCLEINPESAAVMYELANIHVAKGDLTSASLLLEKSISIDSTNDYYQKLLAQIYQQNKRYEKASEIYSRLIERNPGNMDYLYMNAVTLATANRFDDALAVYNEMEKEVGINEGLTVAKQQMYLKKGDEKGAVAEINKLIKKFPDEPRYYGLMADMYLSQDKREEALEYYNKVLEMDPNNGFVHLSLANYYREGKDINKAYDHLQVAFESSSLDVETKIQMLLMLKAPNENFTLTKEKELDLINKMLATHPSDERPRALYVDYLIGNKKLEEARAELRDVVKIKKDNYLYWERLMFLDNDLQDWEGLLADTEKALSYFPNQPLPYVLNAFANMQFDKFDEMIAIVDKGMDFVGENKAMESQMYMYKGEAYYKKKEYKKAWENLDKCVEVDPSNFMAMNNYAYYLSIHGTDLVKAERLSGAAVKSNSSSSTFLDTHAWVLFKKEDYTLAKFYMESAIENDKDNSSVLIEHYGDILFKSGDVEKALEHWTKAQEMGSESKTLKQKIATKKYIEEVVE